MTGDRERGIDMLVDLLFKRIVARWESEQEQLERAQSGDKSIGADQASDALSVAPIDVPIVKP